MAEHIKIGDIKNAAVKKLLSAAFLNGKLRKTDTVSVVTVDLVTYLTTLNGVKPTYEAVGRWAKEHCSVKNPSKSTIKNAFDVVFDNVRRVERKAVPLIDFAIDEYLTKPLSDSLLLKEDKLAIDSVINTATSFILIPLIRLEEEQRRHQKRDGEEEPINFEECSRTVATLILHLLEFPDTNMSHGNCQLIVTKKISVTISYPQINKSLKALSKIQDARKSIIDLSVSRDAEAFVKDYLMPVTKRMIEAKCSHGDVRVALHSMGGNALVPFIKSKLTVV